jgi:hypothetical protein
MTGAGMEATGETAGAGPRAAASPEERCPEDGPPLKVAGAHPAMRKMLRSVAGIALAAALVVLGMEAVVSWNIEIII